ncbi:MAG: hypothetical protein WC716_10420 [Chitinophagaceae bacterium]|jgi:hypothetical protein
MRYLLLSLSAMLFFGLVSCKKNDPELVQRQMSATIKRGSADSGVTWNANPNLVKAEIPFNRSVRFTGSEYGANPTKVNIFINNYKGVGVYTLYQGSAQQTDSNSAVVTFTSRDFQSIKGYVQILRDDKEIYIGRYQILGSSLADTLMVDYGSFTINK